MQKKKKKSQNCGAVGADFRLCKTSFRLSVSFLCSDLQNRRPDLGQVGQGCFVQNSFPLNICAAAAAQCHWSQQRRSQTMDERIALVLNLMKK